MTTSPQSTEFGRPNGAALAALLGAAIGALALGIVVILGEGGILAVPAVYGPAGGVTGRTAIATVVWLIAWALLHRKWNGQQLQARGIFRNALILVVVSLVLTFPPVWRLLP